MKKIDLSNDFIDNEPIMDSIYGVIKISPFEKRILSTKEMQRLRGIKQLGFVNLVYPDAEHSRFAHSIGVCHQSKVLINHTETNLKNNRRYQEWINKFKNTPENSIGITKIEKIVISAAALLHDLPHSPFSHEIETPDIDGKGIPVHDDFENNPIFFNYLFNLEESDLAKIIDIYNTPFIQLLENDNKWKIVLEDKDIKNGYISIHNNGNTLVGESIKYKKLPLLGVMIFELLLFDKVNKWLNINDQGDVSANRDGIDVIISRDGKSIKWKPIKNWFRPYRKDIVANTICADLMDYLLRDGRNTGILPSIDLKFFDRMTIAKAIPDKTNTLIKLENIPDFCEHVVFDIFDHKRGVIRQSVITEIVSFLQQRYLLAERVYNHRVVEGARSMLQEASYLLVSSGTIKIYDLHNINKAGSPISDDAFFAWVLNLDAKNMEIIKAQHLVNMIQKRRIYRELVIIDGMLGQHKGTYRGTDVNCKTLADTLLNYSIRKEITKKLERKVFQYCKKNNIDCPVSEKELLFTIGVRKYGKRYKVPKVLVARPITNLQENDIETFPLFEGRKLPSINDRLESMQLAYNSLWKVYLFIHPFFHSRGFEDLHRELSKLFIRFIYEKTNIKWENSIDDNYADLLPDKPIDIPTFLNEYFDKMNIFTDTKFLLKIIEIVNQSIPEESKSFRLKDSHTKILQNYINRNKSLAKKLNKISDKSKIFDSFQRFNPDLKIAARDKEEGMLKQVINFIDKNISNDQADLF